MSFGISIGDLIKLGEIAGRVYKNCRDCAGNYKSLTTEARSLTNLLDDIQDKYDKIPPHKRQQLIDAYDPCVDILSELDQLLSHYNSLDTKTKRTWDRLTWGPEKSRSLRERLASSIAMLNAFYTSLIHDNQVLILEALERLERDYKGGHREESIASIERITSDTSQGGNDNEDAAWIRIIRDLQDVGISYQVALSYHDFVVDWFIRAVNEGRLLEQSAEPEGLDQIQEPSTITPHQQNFLSKDPGLTPLTIHQDESVSLSAYTTVRPSSTAQSESEHISTHASDMDVFQHSSTISTSDTSLDSQDWSASVISLEITPKRRPSSSDAPEPLHILDPAVANSKPLHLPSPSSNAPELVQLLPPSSEAQGPFFSSIFSFDAPERAQSATSSSEAPEHLPSATHSDMDWRAQQILAAWVQRDFVDASKLLEDHLTAVEGGSVTSVGLQPDRRVLRHCIGVCASFSGNLTKAKYFFESAFNGIYLSRDLDEGDIAAAHWLGDVCLQMREFHNAVLAWSVALEGSIKRYGLAHGRTKQISQELRGMDNWLSVFKKVEDRFHANVDPTNIFMNTHALEKGQLVSRIQEQIPELRSRMAGSFRNDKAHRPTAALKWRPRTDLVVSEGLLVGPVISLAAWPLLWDSTFCPMDIFQMEWYMKILNARTALVDRSLRATSLGDSRKLDFTTKGDKAWLIEMVKALLRELGMEHAEHPEDNAIICCLDRNRDGFACSEGIFISFWKLQFRNVYGLKISNVRWSTRRAPLVKKPCSLMDFDSPDDTTDFKNTFKEMLEIAETRVSCKAPIGNEGVLQTSVRSWPSWKRASTSK